MRVHYLQHVPFEDVANIATWAQEHRHAVTRTRLYEDEPLPDVGEIGLLAVMGGPMNVHQYRDYPWLRKEKTFLERAISVGVPILGVCLGAQLLADVLGAKLVQNPHVEIGWFPVRLTCASADSHLFKNLPAEFTAFHWHGDTFEIPPGAVRRAESDACANQAFEYAGRVVGLQFHLEYTADSIRAMLAHCGKELTSASFIQTQEQVLAGFAHLAQMRELLFAFLDSMAS